LRGLTVLFGVYAGSVAGDDEGGLARGPDDDLPAVSRAVIELQGRPERPFLIRSYLSFTDDTDPAGLHPTLTPRDAACLVGDGRKLDLVAQFQSRSGDVDGYCSFLRSLVAQYGSVLGTLQVTEEPNVAGMATLDGDYPCIQEALVAGVSAAKDALREHDLRDVRVGFNTTPLFGAAEDFIADLVRRGATRFTKDIDYVGLDFFPDVFSPIEPEKLEGAVAWLLSHQREKCLFRAGLSDIPIHITEHGWPTTPGRDLERQAQVVDSVVRAAHAAGVAAYVHFSLRDADTGRDGLFHRFGLMNDRYEPKPAFATFRALVDELSQ
jgi:hypothetical protein